MKPLILPVCLAVSLVAPIDVTPGAQPQPAVEKWADARLPVSSAG